MVILKEYNYPMKEPCASSRSLRFSPNQLFKNHRPVLEYEYLLFQYQLQGFGEYDFFNIPACIGHVGGRVGVIDRDYILRDDLSLVQVVRNKMGGGADNFYPSLKRLSVR